MGIQTVSKIFFHHGLPSISSVSLSHFSLYIKLRYKLLQTHSCLQYTPIKCNNKISVESTLGNLQLKSIIHPSSGVFLLHKSFHTILCRLDSIILSRLHFLNIVYLNITLESVNDRSVDDKRVSIIVRVCYDSLVDVEHCSVIKNLLCVSGIVHSITILIEISVDFVFLISYGVNCLLYSVKVEQVFEYGAHISTFSLLL